MHAIVLFVVITQLHKKKEWTINLRRKNVQLIIQSTTYVLCKNTIVASVITSFLG